MNFCDGFPKEGREKYFHNFLGFFLIFLVFFSIIFLFFTSKNSIFFYKKWGSIYREAKKIGGYCVYYCFILYCR